MVASTTGTVGTDLRLAVDTIDTTPPTVTAVNVNTVNQTDFHLA